MTRTPAPPAPRTIAQALGIAVADGRALLADTETRYHFDAGLWHCARHARPERFDNERWESRADPRTACAVCAAGAVIARSLGARAEQDIGPLSVPRTWRNTLYAIDAMRSFRWERAWDVMHGARVSPLYDACVQFAQQLDTALCDGGPDRYEALRKAGEFEGDEAFARYLDCVETVLLPAVERCEGALLREHMAKTDEGEGRERG